MSIYSKLISFAALVLWLNGSIAKPNWESMSEYESFEETTLGTRIFGKHRPHTIEEYNHLESTEEHYLEEYEMSCASFTGGFGVIFIFSASIFHFLSYYYTYILESL
ncbi:unnamed protein product [Chironomus riparius]|uniref:Uncharacterized protein n=1 Tax=Chironomus riparius TaxID=315576 RepID=A0A9N9WJS4_9DIPT|nr:unnamed protein product [Chironomus riparius]